MLSATVCKTLSCKHDTPHSVAGSSPAQGSIICWICLLMVWLPVMVFPQGTCLFVEQILVSGFGQKLTSGRLKEHSKLKAGLCGSDAKLVG